MRSIYRLISPFLTMTAILFFAVAPVTYAAPQETRIANGSQASASIPQNDLAEVKLLKQQLEDSKKFQEQMLATVYWSLGTLAATAVLLVGFGWFANFRIYERDKMSLERDLRAQMSADLGQIKESVSEANAASASNLEQLLASQLKVASSGIIAQQELALDALERNISSRFTESATKLGRLKKDVLSLQLAAKLAERKLWQEDNVPRNVLQQSVSALVFANEIGYENTVAEILDFISSDMSAILAAKANPIDNFLVAQLVSALDSVTGTHAHIATTLKAGAASLLSA